MAANDPPAGAFRQWIQPEPGDFDKLGHVNNTVYLRWAQEIAVAHWRALAGDDDVARYIWVVARHEIDYRASVLPGEVVTATTWVAEAPKGATWERFVIFDKDPNGMPAVVCRTRWAILDAVRRRPVRPPEAVVAAFRSAAGPPPA